MSRTTGRSRSTTNSPLARSEANGGPQGPRSAFGKPPRMATSPAFRADHVGSFLRPKELLEARHGGAGPERRRAIEDREILRVLARQRELGFELFTDGEFRR